MQGTSRGGASEIGREIFVADTQIRKEIVGDI